MKPPGATVALWKGAPIGFLFRIDMCFHPLMDNKIFSEA